MKSEIVLTDKSVNDMSATDVSHVGFSGGRGVRVLLKTIGHFPDYGAILLIAPIPEAVEPSNWTGMIGSVYALRGSAGGGNVTTKFEVAVSMAHTGSPCLSTPWVSGIGHVMTSGIYRYKGVRYLGIEDSIVSGHDYLFDGIHSGNCCFQLVGKDEAIKE